MRVEDVERESDTAQALVQARRERDEAVAHARALEHQLGRLRGRVKRLELATYGPPALVRRVRAVAGRVKLAVLRRGR